jgi:branched-chain amino acid transport system ATP-binding protein
LLEVRDLHVTYGGAVLALRGVSMDVDSSAVATVLGSNGAGKSTLLRTLSSTLRLHRRTCGGATRRPASPWAWCRCLKAVASSAG